MNRIQSVEYGSVHSLKFQMNEKSNSIDWIFEESRNRLIRDFIPIAYDTREIYLRKIESPDRTNGLILKAIDEGLLILEYAGHGGAETWADEGIFRIENIRQLRNQHPSLCCDDNLSQWAI